MKKLSVARVLNQHQNEVYSQLDKNQNNLSKVTDYIESILMEQKNELFCPQDADRCIAILRNCEHNKNKYGSTIWTWMSGQKC